MNTDIDIAIFVGFLIFNLIVGLSYGRGVKTIKDYALGGRNFSTGALVSTIVATWISGSGFFVTLTKTYSDGLYYVIASSGMALSFIIIAFIFVPRMAEFLGSISIAEAMGGLYGKQVRIITAITGIIADIGSIAVQFKAFGNIFTYFLGIPGDTAIILASLVVTVYSAFGGIRAVTFTDILQFFTFGIAIPLIGILIWNQLYYLDGFSITQALQNPKFNFREVINIGNPEFWHMIPLLLYFTVPGLEPVLCQRIIIGRSLQQVKKAFIISAILVVLIKLIIAWIPFLIFIVNPHLQSGELLGYIIDNYTYTGLRGLMIIGIVGMAMSTADSRINASSVLFANDFCKPLNIWKNKELLLSKIFAFILGGFATILALSAKDLLTIILTAQSFYMPVVTAPLMMTILGFRTTTKSVLIGMIAGFSTVVMWNILAIKIDCIVIATLINFIFLLGSHYLLKQSGGWIKAKTVTFLEEERFERNRKLNKLINSVQNFSFMRFCKETAPKNELMYMGLGIYCIFYTLTTMYSTNIKLSTENSDIILAIYQIMICTGTVLAMYPIWPPRIKKEIIMQVSWHIIIFYMLTFFSCFFVMVSNFGQLQFIVFTLNIVMTAILVGWKLGIGMAVIGFYLSILFYKYYAGIDNLNITIGSPQFVLMYTLMLVGSALIIFLKPKQEQQELTEEKNEHLNGRITNQEKQVKEALALRSQFIRNVNHEYHAPMTGITSLTEILVEKYDRISDVQRRKALKDILKSSRRLDSFDENLSTLSKLSKEGYKLKLESIDLSELLYDRIEICRKLYEENKEDRKFILNIRNALTMKGDRYYLTQALDNLIINAITYCKKGKITLKLEQLETKINFTISDEGIGIPIEELDDIFDEFVVSSRTRSPAGGRGVGLALCKRVIEVHGGEIKAESDGIKGAIFKIMLYQQN